MTAIPATHIRGPSHEDSPLVPLLVLGALVVLCLQLFGCAAGRGPAGEVVVGFDVAKLPETTGQLVNAASAFLPPPFNYIASGVGALVLAGGAGAASRARYKRDTDKAWDESQQAARAEDAERDRAWDEAASRERERSSVASLVAALRPGPVQVQPVGTPPAPVLPPDQTPVVA